MESPKAKTVYQLSMASFCGIDLRNAPANVETFRSPNCVNMIRDTIGTNRKRHGYETVLELEGPINGFHRLKTASIDSYLIHDNNTLYEFYPDTDTVEVVYVGMNNHISVSKQVNSKLYILDGANFVVYDGVTVEDVEDSAYIPTVTIAKGPSGGGTSVEPINLLQPKRIERFMGDSSSLTFQMGAADLDATEVVIKKIGSGGTITTLKEGTDFTVDRTLGTFTLSQPAPPPVDGQDNLYVTYAKTVEGYADRIKKCDIAALFGLNGQRDRLFVSGNPEFPHYDWYCKSNNPEYFGDTWYSVIGQDNSAIIGYTILNGQLLTFKDGADNNSNVVIRVGNYDTNTNAIVFQTSGNYEASGAMNKHCFGTLENEPVYLTVNSSIHAISPSDVLGERSSQERSYYITDALAEEDLTESFAYVYKDFFMITAGDKIYILDSAQASYERNKPYSTRQYEAYLWTGIGARILTEVRGQLYFGTADGKVKRFFTTDIGGAFADDGQIAERTVRLDGHDVVTKETFPCYWETNEIYTGNSTDHRELQKTFKHLVVALNAYAHTGCRIWAKIDGAWEIVFDYDNSANYFDWNDIDFSEFTFRTDNTPTLAGGKFKAKKLLHIQFRFENSKAEPFSILFAKTKYTVGNEYRK